MEAPEVPCLEDPPVLLLEGPEVPSLDVGNKAPSWMPKGMDNTNACRIVVTVGPYVEVCENGKDKYHVTDKFRLVIDRGTANMNKLLDDLSPKVKLGRDQSFCLTFWDKSTSSFVEMASDSQLIDAIDMYWDSRRLPLCVTVSESEPVEPSVEASHGGKEVVIIDGDNAADAIGENAAWAEDWIEYVGVNDETPYNHLLSDVESGSDSDYEPSDGTDDELDIDDTEQCETTVHVTNLESPTINVGVTF